MSVAEAALAYSSHPSDRVREELEVPFFARLLPALLREAGGGALLDLGCGDRLMARLGGRRLDRYVGVDLNPPRDGPVPTDTLVHDLREGLGAVGPVPFDLYLGTFGIASHLEPAELRLLLGDIARHARAGAVVALEGLGLFSLEWPRLWSLPLGPARTIDYRLAADVRVHPWSPSELCALFEDAGIHPVRVVDRSIQAGPKAGDRRNWRGMPAVRAALNALLAGDALAWARHQLATPLPPLPAGPAALVHCTLAARRSALLRGAWREPRRLARAIWDLDPPTAGGYGHGVMVVGRVP